MTDKESIKLDIIASYLNNPLTEEQKEFASDFTKDTISFSDPGTGKTHTLTAGLIMAQKYHKVDGKDIICLSFTNAAVNEMSSRYESLCKKCIVSPTVNFSTFHSFSLRMMKDVYPTINIVNSSNRKQDIIDMAGYMNKLGLNVDSEVDRKYISNVVNSVNGLNSSLTFHPDSIMLKYDFIKLDMELEVFQQLRKMWFLRGITSKVITEGDIPLYCLHALMAKPEVIAKWRGMYEIMVVDEFQDLSLLHLHILSYVAKNLVVIGDMKQQIYAFNGACPQIVEEYLKLHPKAKIANLTKSWRCSQVISDFATSIVRGNYPNIEAFTGHNRESEVRIVPRKDLDWAEIASSIDADIRTHGRANARNVMFIYRNNASAIPIIEELFKRGIPFRCNKFATIMDVPVFNSLSKLALAAWNPKNLSYVKDALSLFPEFNNTLLGGEILPVTSMRSSGKDLFTLNYRYAERSSNEILSAMFAARKSILDKKSAGIVYMKLLEVYKKYILKNEWWKLNYSMEYYLNLVAPICNSKTFPQMYQDELDKERDNYNAIKARQGIRCYTMHTAKGLEADDVYILDCDEGIFPNAKIMGDKLKAGCNYDIACDIRSERNVLYVAITRAKERVIITYSGAEPAKLLVDPTNKEYREFDAIYNATESNRDDAAEFFKLFNLTKYVESSDAEDSEVRSDSIDESEEIVDLE